MEGGYEYTTTSGERYLVVWDGKTTGGCKEYKWNGYGWIPRTIYYLN